jgi:hypothetical protein
LLTEEPGWERLRRAGADPALVERLATIFGISGVCNVLGAIKTAKYYGCGPHDVIATICTDAIDRYRSVMTDLSATYGPLDATVAAERLARIFHGQKTDWIKEGTADMRRQWHNLKYYTWVEQQAAALTSSTPSSTRSSGWPSRPRSPSTTAACAPPARPSPASRTMTWSN